ncbi:hypothetical protein GGQ22_10715 [Nocardioides sp. zg-579]|uniref:DUF308 domain-containing protein n=1 Tax=Nocardioides marmotae TaxID=2663857 RepID=A0A6I3JBQ5_9ACTN|nr:hypothetical protein [Nocardioides marmotae]MCR6031917.1 hypothetical protein [Gordonia jinghuaiqii]MTB95557.1 hypothetical protein [Nocardioides marmotae]QKE00980.1 hypothetical protein HPC71_07775 [Nocardioides marmotae]
MKRDDEDDAWRSIVENYGDRPTLDEDPPPTLATPVDTGPVEGPDAGPVDAGPPTYHVDLPEEPESDLGRADEERFVPPPPPPLPRPRGVRAAAWAGVFGAPAVLLLCLVLAVDLPQFVGYLLVGAFVGGFLYLVLQMPRGPRDPWDDGAQL